VIFVLFAIAFAVAWTLVKGSVRRAEERRRAAVEAPQTPAGIFSSNN
jgi:hypothetical protein